MTPLRSISSRTIFPWMIALPLMITAPAFSQVGQSYFERSTETYNLVETMTGSDRLRLIASDRLTELIDAAMDTGHYRDAIGYAEAQLALRQNVLGDRHPETIPALIAHGFACWRQSRFADGEQSLRQAREIIELHIGSHHPETARCLDLLGLCRMAQGYHVEAKQLYFEALDIALETCGENHEITIACYDDLGAVHQEQSRLVQSEPFRRKALALSRQLNGTEHLTTARLTHNLGKLVIRFGDYQGAEELFREAMEIRIRLLGADHPDVAASMEFLGSALTLQRRLEEAELYLRRALEIRRNTLGEDHHLTAMNVGRLAHVCSVRGDLAECLEFLHEELAIRRRVYGNAHVNIVRSLRTIAAVYTRMGDYDKAEQYLLEAKETIEGPALETFTGWYLDSYLGQVAMLRGDYNRAEHIFAGITAGFERARGQETNHDRRTTHSSGGNPYLNLAAMRLLNHKAEEAWPAMEHFLGRGLFELLQAFGDNPLSPAESARDDSLNSVLLSLEQQLAVLEDETENGTRSPELGERVETIRTRLLETQSERGTFRENMRIKYPVAGGKAFPLERVQASLDDHTAIIGWLDLTLQPAKQMAWVYVVRSHGPVSWVHLPAVTDTTGDGDLDRQPRRFREALAGAASWPYRVTSTEKINWMAGQLYRQRISPIETRLEGIDHLVVIPTGVMQGIPVEALIGADGRHTGDCFTISYTSSGTVHTWFRERENTGRNRFERALVVGDPRIKTHDSIPTAAFTSLPASRREVERVTSLLPGVVKLAGTGASEVSLVQLAPELDRFDIVHLATHASINSDRPGDSYLVLSREDLPDPLESAMKGRRIYDGRLTAQEIVREWNLDADLVVLSACETALGKQTWGEGFVGFAHAFLQSGAHCVVVSLWEVDDEAASLLMGRFYENLTGAYATPRLNGQHGPLSRADALCEAKRWLRSYTTDHGETPYRHPAYWSAFILVGDSG